MGGAGWLAAARAGGARLRPPRAGPDARLRLRLLDELVEVEAVLLADLAEARLGGLLLAVRLLLRLLHPLLGALGELPGIGEWSAQMFLLFRLGRLDVFAPGDLTGLREIRTLDVAGQPIKLTIDAGLQDYASRRIGLESAAVVVIDCETGGILTLTSMPAFDPNSFVGCLNKCANGDQACQRGAAMLLWEGAGVRSLRSVLRDPAPSVAT